MDAKSFLSLGMWLITAYLVGAMLFMVYLGLTGKKTQMDMGYTLKCAWRDFVFLQYVRFYVAKKRNLTLKELVLLFTFSEDTIRKMAEANYRVFKQDPEVECALFDLGLLPKYMKCYLFCAGPIIQKTENSAIRFVELCGKTKDYVIEAFKEGGFRGKSAKDLLDTTPYGGPYLGKMKDYVIETLKKEFKDQKFPEECYKEYELEEVAFIVARFWSDLLKYDAFAKRMVAYDIDNFYITYLFRKFAIADMGIKRLGYVVDKFPKDVRLTNWFIRFAPEDLILKRLKSVSIDKLLLDDPVRRILERLVSKVTEKKDDKAYNQNTRKLIRKTELWKKVLEDTEISRSLRAKLVTKKLVDENKEFFKELLIKGKFLPEWVQFCGDLFVPEENQEVSRKDAELMGKYLTQVADIYSPIFNKVKWNPLFIGAFLERMDKCALSNLNEKRYFIRLIKANKDILHIFEQKLLGTFIRNLKGIV